MPAPTPVRERYGRATYYLRPDQIAYYLRAREVSDRVKKALQQVVQLRERLNQTQAERTRLEQTVAAIAQEQTRIRENMGKLVLKLERAPTLLRAT